MSEDNISERRPVPEAETEERGSVAEASNPTNVTDRQVALDTPSAAYQIGVAPPDFRAVPVPHIEPARPPSYDGADVQPVNSTASAASDPRLELEPLAGATPPPRTVVGEPPLPPSWGQEKAGAASPSSVNFYNPTVVRGEGDGPVAYQTGNEVQRVADAITVELRKAIVGQEDAIESSIAAMFADGHVLLEGVPGTAKTLIVRALAMAVSAEFKRIQFTPDLMPSDITGTRIFDQKAMEFIFKPGPIFTGLLLADEVNRTPPKTQAALLEAMQEHRVTIDGETHQLPSVFLVFATQNPIEFEGTYPLPEAQLDRFLLKILVGYPSADSELTILRRYHQGFDANDLTTAGIQPAADAATILRCRSLVTGVRVEDSMFKYISSLVLATREHRHLVLGGGPRASIALLQVGKALAAMRGRDYLIPDDVKSIAPAVLRHRLLLRPEAEIEGVTADSVIDGILAGLEVPR